jgi:hypothetical protein
MSYNDDSNFRAQTQYRETEEGRKVIPLDEAELIIGIQAAGVMPICCLTNGTKLKMIFYEDEALPKYQRISQGLVGSGPEPFMVDYILELRARRNWNQELAMMRSMNRPRS